MNIAVVYPVPLENEEVWKLFLPVVHRFAETYRHYEGGTEHELMVVCNGADPTPDLKSIFSKLPATFIRYDGGGCDLGSQQMVAKELRNTFQVNLTSRVHFHRPGWLFRLLAARNKMGPSLFGVSASWESGKLHICTRGHAYDTEDFRNYPIEIKSRDEGVFFECGAGCLMEWMEGIDRIPYVVSWDGIYPKGMWFKMPNRFRNGDQRGMLFHDKHSDAYRDAPLEEKERLTRLSEPPV